MGYLDSGSTLLWNDAKHYTEKIKKEGLKQFLSLWKNHKQRHDTCLNWGDELGTLNFVEDIFFVT
jgi:glutamate--cysteine ligase catalytic subunit